MAPASMDILDNLVQTLRSTGKFSLVSLGEAGSAAAVPRARVIYEGQESFQPDDSASTRWTRLRAVVSVRTRATGGEAVTRIGSLCQAAMDSVLADPYRGGLCQDLPIGRATEVGRGQLAGHLRRPEVEMSFDVRCHFELQGAE